MQKGCGQVTEALATHKNPSEEMDEACFSIMFDLDLLLYGEETVRRASPCKERGGMGGAPKVAPSPRRGGGMGGAPNVARLTRPGRAPLEDGGMGCVAPNEVRLLS